MRPPNNNKRGRGRPNNRRSSNPNRSYDSNGPDGKIRGNASQVYEKYSQLARDSAASGDPIAAEGFWQHAEHYYRIMMAQQQSQQQNQPNNRNQNNQQSNDQQSGDRDDNVADSNDQRGGANAPTDAPSADPAVQEQPDIAPVKAEGEAAVMEESETAGLERAVRRSRPRRPRKPREEEAEAAPAEAAEGAAD